MGKSNGRVLIDRNRETTFCHQMASLALTANVWSYFYIRTTFHLTTTTKLVVMHVYNKAHFGFVLFFYYQRVPYCKRIRALTKIWNLKWLDVLGTLGF